MTPEQDTRPAQPVTPSTTADEERLVAEFAVLAAEFPQFGQPEELPAGVRDTAATANICLLDAYLRYRWQEEKRVVAAAEKRQEAAAHSAGSLSRGAPREEPAEDAFLRAFRAAL